MTDAARAHGPPFAPGEGDDPGSLSTFLFTDIEGSTRLWEEHAGAMGAALAQHDRLLRASHRGTSAAPSSRRPATGCWPSSATRCAAVDAALAAQRALRDATWGETGPLRVRMALHTGAAEARDGDYFGPALNRVARILAIGHGGQVICSAVAAVLARDRLPSSVELVDLGSHRLRDIDRPEQVYQVVVDDLPRTFPPLRSLSTRRSNLPVQLTSFVGRERELDEVADAHRPTPAGHAHRHGWDRQDPPHAGGRRAVSSTATPDGVWLAELAPLGDPSQIPSEVARALGAPEIPGVPAIATVTAFVAEKDLLLLLDNAEHLVDGVATVRRTAAGAARPGLRILTTSREALAVPGEAVLQLQSLSCPSIGAGRPAISADPPVDIEEAASTEAVRLFIERATAVDPAFTLGESNVASVVGDLPAPGRHPARDRARGGAGLGDVTGRHRRAARATGSACWPAAAGRPSRASRRSTRSSTGAGTSSRTRTGASSGGCRCSPGAGRSRWRPGSSATDPRGWIRWTWRTV